jgi:primosomal protein N' (replication factor Y) (superfamily II helicase)
VNEFLLSIAVPTPLHRSFDYLPPPETDLTALQPGVRVRVPFGARTAIGILLEVTAYSRIDRERLKHALAVLDPSPVLTADVLAMARWASAYYQYPIGETLSAALPTPLRGGESPTDLEDSDWRLTAAGARIDPATLRRAPRQAAVLRQLHLRPHGVRRAEFEATPEVLRTLHEKGWIEVCTLAASETRAPAERETGHVLNAAQQSAVGAVRETLGEFAAFLLEGVTGSGKTEVYLRIIDAVITQRRQALILVPEIGLTPQLVERFRRRFGVPLALLHSALNDRERLAAWRRAGSGEALIVIGTRSAIFTPLARPGVLVVDEEHDASLKQQDGLRYSARDLAVWRARQLAVPVVLGSATPSLESLYNVARSRYRCLLLPERTGSAGLPSYEILDLRRQPLEHGLSRGMLARIRNHLAENGQVLLFLNRRGYAPTLICHDCGWIAGCTRCDARMTVHQAEGQLHCHHCGSQRPTDTCCPECGGGDLRPLGQGTERVEQALAEHFPEVERLRIDRDTTRRKGQLASLLQQARAGHGRILLGTQMLAKGHHFPDVTLVGILNVDQGLFGIDFRASERMAQLIIQVAGRAGRRDRSGHVVIQTHHPDHPLLQVLVRQGYPAFARAALAEREAARLPPTSHIALVRAEAMEATLPAGFLEGVKQQIHELGADGVEVWGPVPSGMERRAGRYRAQLLLQSAHRGSLQRVLGDLVRQLEQTRAARKVRWSVDVDPADMF